MNKSRFTIFVSLLIATAVCDAQNSESPPGWIKGKARVGPGTIDYAKAGSSPAASAASFDLPSETTPDFAAAATPDIAALARGLENDLKRARN